ncbi:hypothetical protein [Aquiflexum lacus]|uniref:hypothetical protein n=1 Tax=Aquiflexum lacus TaxID=2483805 RepID=UPI001895A508|nr:hypothetical protein [Aquiflexum lacus]
MPKIQYFIIFLCVALACQPQTEYDKVKETELASGKVFEDLFLDIQFGMDRKTFYGTCWEHNKNGILTNGAHYLQILYHPELPSGKKVNMHFYPKFEENKLYYMPIELTYTDWFPTNDAYSNDKLMEDTVGLLENWFGTGFFPVSNKAKTVTAQVKIDGNRHVRVFKKDIKTVRVEILDLRIKDLKDMIEQNDEA